LRSGGTIFEPNVLWLFVITCAVAVVSPGPDTLLVLGNTFGGGRKRGFTTALGVCSGFLVHITAAVLGLTAIVLASATLFTLVKLAGAAYLIYLGIQAWRSDGTLPLNAGEQTTTLGFFTQGFLGNVLNPKVILFFMALIPQFVNASAGNVPLQVVVFGAIDIGLSFGWYVIRICVRG
jgi:threonine/homoserine/homoserine lactone efflux protein